MARAVAPARAPASAVRIRRRLPGYTVGYLFVGPVILYLIATSVYPIITVVGMGLQDVDRGVWRFVGLDHYAKILVDRIWWNAVVNTSIFTVASVVLQLSIGLAFALLLHEAWFNRTLRDTMRGALILPWVFSTAAAALMWLLMYDPYGLFNYITTGILGWPRPIDFLGNPNLALGSVILVNTWKSYPFYMIAMLGGLQSIPPELYDQLVLGGRMVIPIGTDRPQVLKFVTRTPAGPLITDGCPCSFVPLIGQAGWQS